MGERPRPYELAFGFAEVIYLALETEYAQGRRDLDAMMVRLKDLSAYSLEHAEILEQREGVELLGLAMFFGATSDSSFHKNQARLRLLSEETVAYPGRAEVVMEQIARRQAARPARQDEKNGQPRQRHLL